LKLILTTLLALAGFPAWAVTVSLAGFSYAGDHQSLDSRFPHTRRVTEAMAAEKSSADRLIADTLAATRIDHFTLQQGELAQLKGSDQSIAVSLVITNETTLVEKIGGVYKLFLQLRAQVMFFDFKTMTVLRSYPFDVPFLDVLPTPPTDAEIEERVRTMIVGGKKAGLVQRFAGQLAAATLPDQVPRFLQVSKVTIGPEAMATLPAALQATPGTAETWLADQFSEAISSSTGVPVLPYAKGYAIGNVMAMRFADGTVFNLKIPEADYAFSVNLTQFKRVKTGESVAGISYVYGTFADLKLEEPLSGRAYLDNKFKNGETKAVPALQAEVDDFPAYADSVRGLFTKLTAAFAGRGDPAWIKSATSASPTIDAQLSATKTVLQSCK